MELMSIGKFAKNVGVNVVTLATKIRLKPTKEQEVLFLRQINDLFLWIKVG
ncbi:helix-turn-helix domain-containing protein [Lysinibacillus xylanilyticus]|uniref:helix-turn-helix domain-containing protein n=1 Tax=Lysinibacillus xylanilyticus TaxID=582475 RepID=UPI003CFD4DB9